MIKKILTLTMMVILAIGFAKAETTTVGLQTKQPAGELKTYERTGYSWYVNTGYARRGMQTGTIDIVYAANHVVYLKDPLAKAPTGVWVKGTINEEGTQVTLPVGQRIAYDTEVKDYIVLAMMDYDEDEEDFYENTSHKEVTFKVDADGNLKMQGTSKNYALAAMWENSKEWAEYADYESKYTIQTEKDEYVQAPADLTTSKYMFTGHSYVSDRDISYNVELGFKGNDAYAKGLLSDCPNVWVKGVKEGNKLTFPSGQYIGPAHSGTTNYYMIAVNRQNTSEIQDFVLNYDEATGNYSNATQFLVLNTARKTVYLVEAYRDITLEKKMQNDYYEIPYEASFAGGLDDYTIIDANKDGVTWTGNRTNQTADYNWSNNNDANDWLITPKVKLESGKKYKVAVTARSMAGKLERFELKAGKDNTAEAMTLSIMPSTDVETQDFTDFTGTFTCSEEGTYNFGLHAISDKGNWGLYIQSIMIESADATDGINNIIESEKRAQGTVYTLDGRLVKTNVKSTDELEKGVYIFNSKKIIIK